MKLTEGNKNKIQKRNKNKKNPTLHLQSSELKDLKKRTKLEE